MEIVEKINPNAYRLKLLSHIRTSDIFNVKHLMPFMGTTLMMIILFLSQIQGKIFFNQGRMMR
ncbi:hypothetical protein PanWU01x14_134360 [Parasponia andersonii]|uniref:Tf2-1-like SH3-like domain-containing protein n=1 Tax=Parasponia andersonii TaxID=3476 RepID=A0A2P5CPL5_PARAD|nr:hypothetical protein PanWU01x14_134360 [Parasponia andersonii]